VNVLLNVFAATQTSTADSIYGDQVTNELNWTAHDPTVLASNLGNTNIYQFFGNGLAGPLDPIDPTNIDDDGSIVLWGALEAVI
jgi:S-formylglutathione hydrolase FrmB